MKTLQAKHGRLAALSAFVIWGVFPLYFGLLRGVSPFRVVAHRVLWSGLLSSLLLIFWLRRPLADLVRAGGLRTSLARLGVTALLLAFNWAVYLYAMSAGRVVESSLGYFINPLVSVLLGWCFLKERLSPVQIVGVGLATVAVLILSAGSFPTIAILLALSFATYGLLRKQLPLDPLLASCLESLLLMPVAAGYLLCSPADPHPVAIDLLLVGTGLCSMTPLLLFNLGAKAIPYSTLGLLQYVTPTLQFACAVFFFAEPVSRRQLGSFTLIWLALALSAVDAIWGPHASKKARKLGGRFS